MRRARNTLSGLQESILHTLDTQPSKVSSTEIDAKEIEKDFKDLKIKNSIKTPTVDEKQNMNNQENIKTSSPMKKKDSTRRQTVYWNFSHTGRFRNKENSKNDEDKEEELKSRKRRINGILESARRKFGVKYAFNKKGEVRTVQNL
ncbi:hypothetical protein SNEBB_008005 [Seison nebaliae]|nr:hypothetical protein SNEBB_008005 [Seison nebaliae]